MDPGTRRRGQEHGRDRRAALSSTRTRSDDEIARHHPRRCVPRLQPLQAVARPTVSAQRTSAINASGGVRRSVEGCVHEHRRDDTAGARREQAEPDARGGGGRDHRCDRTEASPPARAERAPAAFESNASIPGARATSRTAPTTSRRRQRLDRRRPNSAVRPLRNSSFFRRARCRAGCAPRARTTRAGARLRSRADRRSVHGSKGGSRRPPRRACRTTGDRAESETVTRECGRQPEFVERRAREQCEAGDATGDEQVRGCDRRTERAVTTALPENVSATAASSRPSSHGLRSDSMLSCRSSRN